MTTITKHVTFQCTSLEYDDVKVYVQENANNPGISNVVYDDAAHRITLTETIEA